jgi:dUTP pyrophosphatase
MKLPIQKLEPSARIPTKGSVSAAGYDLYAVESCFIEKGHRATVKTGIAVAIPEGHYGRIAPRSGLAAKNGIDVLGGVIDADYRGELKVILQNNGEFLRITDGDRIAQLIIERCYDAELVEFPELPPSDRGQGGLGSTGK